ncbi:MAG: hypothetical protein ACE5GU_08725 [Candidatus Scalinduaceae bacterium]
MQESLKKRDRGVVVKLSIITILAFICCITLIMVAAERPESPEFCARCHSMESSYNTWKETVACNTGCLNCHTHDNNGRTLSVEIKDSNCTSIECHPIEKLVSEASKHKETISFKHETHIKEYATNLRMQCTGCHTYPGKGRKEVKHFSIDENACYVCHFTNCNTPLPLKIQEAPDFRREMSSNVKNKIEISSIPQGKDIRGLLTGNDKKNIDDCSLCHKDIKIKIMIYKKEFDHLKFEKELKVECTNCHFETVHKNKGVDEKSCYYCHTKVPKEYTGADRMHNDHVKEHKVPCSPCHNEIQHKWDDEYVRFVLPKRGVDIQNKYLMKIANIGKGTNLNDLPVSPKGGKNVLNDEPYIFQKRVYKGIYGRGVEESPDPMYLATVNCTACHKDKDLSVDPMVCNTCHEKGFEKTMAEQKDYTTRMLNVLSGLLSESQKQGVPKYLIDEARYNYDLIVSDGSLGVHNIKYVKDLITHSIQQLQLVPKLQLENEVN